MEKLEVSWVIPLYNEERRLEPRLSESLNFLAVRLNQTFEIIFVNDGSTDKTLTLLNETKNKFNSLTIKIISYDKNQGKGYAVKQGVLEARGQKIIVCDADFSVDLEEMDRFLELLDQYPIVVGSKKHLQTDTRRRQKIPRRVLGLGFTWLSNKVLGLNFTDVTCGFRGFRKDSAKKLFSKQLMKRWSYDAEILFLAKKNNYQTYEVPVKWHHIEGSKVSPLYDSFQSLRDLLAIILNYRYGKYN